MGIDEGEYVMSFESRDGKPIAQRVTPASTEDSFAISGLTRDGKTAAVSVSPVTDSDQIAISALTRDGKAAALRFVGGITIILFPKTIADATSSTAGIDCSMLVMFDYPTARANLYRSNIMFTNQRSFTPDDEEFWKDVFGTSETEITMQVRLVSGGGTLFLPFSATPAPIIDGLPTVEKDASLTTVGASAFNTMRYGMAAGVSKEDIELQFVVKLKISGEILEDVTRTISVVKLAGISPTFGTPANAHKFGKKDLGTGFIFDLIVLNSLFSNWTADDPDDWAVTGESGTDPEVSEVSSGQTHGGTGSNACNIFTTGGSISIDQTVTGLEVGKNYEVYINLSATAGGTLRVFDDANGQFDFTITSVAEISEKFTCTNSTIKIKIENSTDSVDVTITTLNVTRVDYFDDALADFLNSPTFSASLPITAGNYFESYSMIPRAQVNSADVSDIEYFTFKITIEDIGSQDTETAIRTYDAFLDNTTSEMIDNASDPIVTLDTDYFFMPSGQKLPSVQHQDFDKSQGETEGIIEISATGKSRIATSGKFSSGDSTLVAKFTVTPTSLNTRISKLDLSFVISAAGGGNTVNFSRPIRILSGAFGKLA